MPKIEKTIELGKIAYLGKRKINPVELTIALEDRKAGPVFTASAAVWNKSKTDYLIVGQCLDRLVPHLGGNETFMMVYRLWKAYHLNNMKAGTPKQEAAVKEYLKDHAYDYGEVCDYLESIDLLEDDGYRYGTAWMYEPIPEADLKEIRELLT